MFLNRLVSVIISPLNLGLVMLLVGVLFPTRQIPSRRISYIGIILCACSFLWFWGWSTPVFFGILVAQTEGRWQPQNIADIPSADAIVVLGGGIGKRPEMPYPELYNGADRVWHAARLYKAGKAKLIIPTGGSEDVASLPFLVDLGVPKDAIRPEINARNTEENAKFVPKIVTEYLNESGKTNRVPKILLVTSAFHMTRAVLNFKNETDLLVIPAPTDFEGLQNTHTGVLLSDFIPSCECFWRNNALWKELIGTFLYKFKYRAKDFRYGCIPEYL